MDKAKVVCVLKTGGVYTSEYVKRLHDDCVKCGANDFVCITDDPSVGSICKTLPLTDGLPGWWSKLEMFKLTSGKHVYIDLDTIIDGDITDLLTYDHKFTMLRDFNKRVDRPASGIMAWTGDWSRIYESFDTSMIDKYDPKKGGALGDQAYITDQLGFKPDYVQTLFPGWVASYKWNTFSERRKCRIICYHGRPRPHETGWRK